ncbi:MAG: hypothetical protein O7C56_07535 [Rickettsia endosymbiont of Ixodes persulcatus]|nr:hypothetical protein [Rickettsia endosymbiont of Ixodes persulcatus]
MSDIVNLNIKMLFNVFSLVFFINWITYFSKIFVEQDADIVISLDFPLELPVEFDLLDDLPLCSVSLYDSIAS